MQLRHAALVLADISGYTAFLREHARTQTVLHAEAIITDLLEAVIDSAEYPLTLAKLEGDAAFFYALSDGTGPDGAPVDEHRVARDVAAQVVRFFGAFEAKVRT